MRLLHAPDVGGSTDSINVYIMPFCSRVPLFVLTDLKGQRICRLLQEALLPRYHRICSPNSTNHWLDYNLLYVYDYLEFAVPYYALIMLQM
jgi:hypothetical protein